MHSALPASLPIIANPGMDAGTRGAAQVRHVPVAGAKGHVSRPAQQDRPSVVSEQRLFPRRADAIDVIGGVARHVQLAGVIEREPVRKTPGLLGVPLRCAGREVNAKDLFCIALHHEQMTLVIAQRQTVGIPVAAADHLAFAIRCEPQQPAIVPFPIA